MIALAYVALWSLICLVVYSMLSHKHDTRSKCCRCPDGSWTSSGAIPLTLMECEEAHVLVEALGLDPSEKWCRHCVRFAIDVLTHARGDRG